jgi:ADP-ribosylglycohydrolase
MLGAIIGDTVGSHYEFHNTKEYHFKLFAEKYPCPMGDYGGLFRQWLFTPEANWPDCGTPYQSTTGRRPYGSWGNGSAMRVSAVGGFFDTLEEAERVAEVSAAAVRKPE